MRSRTLASIPAAPLAAAAVSVAVASGAPTASQHGATANRAITLFQGADEPQGSSTPLCFPRPVTQDRHAFAHPLAITSTSALRCSLGKADLESGEST